MCHRKGDISVTTLYVCMCVCLRVCLQGNTGKFKEEVERTDALMKELMQGHSLLQDQVVGTFAAIKQLLCQKEVVSFYIASCSKEW